MKCKECGHEIQENINWVSIPELNIEVSKELNQKDICMKDVKIPTGMRVLTLQEINYITSSKKYSKLIKFEDCEFFKQIFKINERKYPYSVLYLCRGRVLDLDARYDDLAYSYSNGRVRFCREIKK